MRGVSAVLILALATGCSNRERLNPLDPSNPTTHGSPTGFAAFAGDGYALIAWDPAGSADVAGYRLYRRVAPDPQFVALGGVLPPNVTEFQDVGLANGVDHVYQLRFVVGDRLSLPAEDTATPGPARPWVTDYAGASLLRITPDARHVGERALASFSGPTALDVDPGTGQVWVCDYDGRRVGLYDPVNHSLVWVGSGLSPIAIAVDRSTGRAWVCDWDGGSLCRLDPAARGLPPACLSGFSHPISVAVDQADGSVWVCEQSADRVRHLTSDGSPLSAATVVSPSRVAVYAITRSVWVTSFSERRVVHLSPAGQPRDTVGGFQGPIGVATDSGGRVWVADAAGDQVVVLDALGHVAFRVPGLSEAHAVAIDPVTGEAWITLPGIGAVARLDKNGGAQRRITGLRKPYEIALHRPRELASSARSAAPAFLR